ncbi:MAG: holo-ACP synthase [Gammaproteobacteria bacterium]|nr:holo-ACP synthase [Gammaproteobacteria bacterium]
MIVGIGVDITTRSRIEGVHRRFKARFAKRFLHSEEMNRYVELEDAGAFLAKRFAAKEAAVKALGTGEREGVLLKDFYIHHDERGKPILQVTGEAAKRCDQLGITQMHISLSDEGDQVVAFVVLEK